jgi:tetraacyldisaccharide 4'-kinase
MTWPIDPAWSALALPLSWAFRAVVGARNAAYDRRIGVRQPPIPVLSVGNLAVGGTGKTPLVARLATLLRELGARPAVVSRGYGGQAGRGPLRVRPDRRDGSALRFGDEPWMLASRDPDLPVYVGSDRLAGTVAAAADGADVAVLDDGFQHRRVARRLDVVVLPARSPLGNGRCLPAGPLREPASSLRRAEVVVRVGGPGEAVEPLPGAGRPAIGEFHAVRRPAGFASPEGREVPEPRRVVAFCGIGNPGSFRSLLEALDVRVEEFVSFPDHHPFGARDLAALETRAERLRAPLLTTEKDAARLLGSPAPPSLLERLVVLRMDLAIAHEDALKRALQVALDRGTPR